MAGMIYSDFFAGLEEAGIKYLVVGGLAVILHGYPRATADLDIMILLDEDNIKNFIAAVKKMGYQPKLPVKFEDFADPDKRQVWFRTRNMKFFTIYHPRKELQQIDIAIADLIDFGKAYQNREEVKAEGLNIPLASLDDLIKLKEMAGRSRDLIDIEALKEIKKVKNGEKK